MADVKWIKITTNIFNDEKIQLIESMPDSDTIIVIWFKLLALAGKSNNSGLVVFNDNIPYTTEMLVTLFRRKESVISLALKTFQSFKMIEILENNTILISNWEKHQNLIGLDNIREQNRVRKQKQREREKLLIDNNMSRDLSRDVTQQNKNKKEIYTKETPPKGGTKKSVTTTHPTLQDIVDFISKNHVLVDGKEAPFVTDPETYFNKRESVGWVTNGNLEIQDWRADLIAWEKREQEYIAERNQKSTNKKSSRPEVSIDWLSDYIETQN